MTAQQLGEMVHAARQTHGHSLRRLQQLCGVEYSYIAYLEQGRISTPDPRKLLRLAQALDLNAADLYAAAGYLDPHALPDLVPYLIAKYDLPEPIAEQVADYVRQLHPEPGATP